MAYNKKDIIVIGASAGGYEAICKILKNIPKEFPASIVLVNHLSPSSTGEGLVTYLKKNTKLNCVLAHDGDELQKGTVYIAPADFHTLLSKEGLVVVRGPRENKYRPAIDPMFRSAAVAFSSRVIGIILTGMLEDGTMGMKAIKDCGGTTIIQDPEEATFPDMPVVVKNSVQVDYILSIKEIANLLVELVNQVAEEIKEVPEHLKLENEVATRFITGNQVVEQLGEVAPYVCPDCGGSLWQRDMEGSVLFRCHSGHSYDMHSLLHRKTQGLEESFWISLRILEEKKNLLLLMQSKDKSNNSHQQESYKERVKEINTHINRIREFLFQHRTENKDLHVLD